MRYQREVIVLTDLLIRDVPDEVVAAIDANAKRLGLSRTEYLRRRLASDALRSMETVSTADLSRFAETFSDLADPDVMAAVWE